MNLNNSLIIVIILLSGVVTLTAQAPPSTYADDAFIENADQFVEGQGVRMGGNQRNYQESVVQEIEIERYPSYSETHETTDNIEHSLTRAKRKSSFGLSFSDLAKSTRKESSSGNKSSLTFTFSDLADSAKSKGEDPAPTKNRQRAKRNRVKLPTR
jgi:hypothetical protein